MIALTLRERPGNAAHGNIRTMAAQVRTTPCLPHKIRQARGPKPRLTRSSPAPASLPSPPG